MPSATRSFFSSWPFVLAVALLGAVLATLASSLLPWRYAADVQILVSQNTAASIDPYTAIKSSERIATNLGDLVYTSKFTEKILANAKNFDTSVFPSDEIDRRNAWQEMIEVSVTPGSGMLTLTVLHTDKKQALVLAQATAEVLTGEVSNYFGYNVRAEEVNAPVASKWVARPRFVRNAGLGFFGGFVIGLTYVIWQLRRKEGHS
ncbi:MAG: hypothetical protein Q7R83_04485 [bacterium]|nr:hypothetical protein [bacterium]